MKRKRIDGAEQDLFSRRWRHVLSWRPGERDWIRRKTHKRERREGRRDAAARAWEERTEA